MTYEHLRFSPSILVRLGEEMNPHPDQGILELVRNAYDADAGQCIIELNGVQGHGGSISIMDNGHGMEPSSIRGGFLLVGASAKSVKRLTKGGRVPVGNKGLGRIAALRLGTTVNITSIHEDSLTEVHSLVICWDDFERVDAVEQVNLEVTTRPRGIADFQGPGTKIEIHNLRASLSRNDVKRLARSLLLLGDPFAASQGFKPSLVSKEFVDLERLVQQGYFNEAEYHLIAEVDNQGLASAEIRDFRGKLIFRADHTCLSTRNKKDHESPPYRCPPLRFELWAFNLKSESFAATRETSLRDVREWLAAVGGVHVYYHDLRVAPYGDAGHDWLEMDLARARSPELRPSTNTAIGRVSIRDPDAMLTQKTDRSGFVENDAFNEIRRFAKCALDWMAKERLHVREKKRSAEKKQAPKAASRARRSMEEIISDVHVPPRQREKILESIKRYDRARDREVEAVRKDLLLYRLLATVGTTTASTAHEVSRAVTNIDINARIVDRKARTLLGDQFPLTLEPPVRRIIVASKSLTTFSKIALTLLSRDKRRRSRVDINRIISDIVPLFAPLLESSKIDTETILTPTNPAIWGTVASIESIIANFISNSLRAFARGTIFARRVISIKTTIDDHNFIRIDIDDSGPGIQDIKISDIWLPGETTDPEGTGLGLTIVRDTVHELGGRVDAQPNGTLGGAAFSVMLPIMETA